MDNTNFQLLLELLERESSARIAAEEARVAENSVFQQIIEDLNTTIKQLNDTIGLLLEENRLLKGPKKNSSNSSVPPSKDPSRPKRTSSLRKSSGKSSGGQRGHDGSTLQMCSTLDVLIDHRSDFCNCCGLDLVDHPGQLTSRRQVIDIPPIAPLYTEHRVFQKKCTCGHKTSGTFPKGVSAPISYGPQTSAVIAYLHTRQFIPLSRISEFFTSVCNMPISQGTICGILDRLAEKALPAFELIKQAVCKSSVVGSDETGVNLNGELHWIWTWQSQKATYITFSSSRGKQTIQDNFPEGFDNSILVSDCLASQLGTQARGHQICTTHLLRCFSYKRSTKVTGLIAFGICYLTAYN